MNSSSSHLLRHIDSDFLNYLIEQDLNPGDRVPPLGELSKELNLSISKLREQLEVARSLGLVEVRPRTGIRRTEFSFIPALRMAVFFALANDTSTFELYSNLRIHIEAAYWHEAAALLTAEDKAELQTLISDAWAKLNGDHITIPHFEHRAFHMTIFRRLENPFVTGILETYWEAYEAVALNRYADYAYLKNVWTYHERIAEEIIACNYDASLDAFIEHTRLLRHQTGSPTAEVTSLKPSAKSNNNKGKTL